MPRHKTIDYSFGKVVHQLRTSQLCALNAQLLILYLEHDVSSWVRLLALTLVISYNMYVVGSRWFGEVDGRYDAQRLFIEKNSSLRAQYAVELFGGFVFAFLAHHWSPKIQSGMGSFCYDVVDYVSICTGLACLFVECYEGLKDLVH